MVPHPVPWNLYDPFGTIANPVDSTGYILSRDCPAGYYPSESAVQDPYGARRFVEKCEPCAGGLFSPGVNAACQRCPGGAVSEKGTEEKVKSSEGKEKSPGDAQRVGVNCRQSDAAVASVREPGRCAGGPPPPSLTACVEVPQHRVTS